MKERDILCEQEGKKVSHLVLIVEFEELINIQDEFPFLSFSMI